VPLVASSFKKMMAARIEQIPAFDGVTEMLIRLHHHGIALSLVTSNSFENVERILGPNNMKLMRYPQCNTSLFGKRAALRRILQQTQMHRDSVIYIGDELRDIEAAHAEAIAFGAVSWGYTRMDALLEHQPTEVFHNVEEVVSTLTGADLLTASQNSL